MTLILGVEDPENNRAIVFSDSGAWLGDTTQELLEPKVWRCGGWVLGIAGRIADSQSMRRRAIAEPAGDLGAFECLSKWANGVLREIHQRDLAVGAKDPSKPGIVAAHGATVWEVDSLGAVNRTVGGFQSAGYADEAMGALVALAQISEVGPHERGSRAMLAARLLNKHVHGRIDWKSTDGGEGSIA